MGKTNRQRQGESSNRVRSQIRPQSRYRRLWPNRAISFDVYNEGNVFISAIERFRERTGCYPERVLVDQIYRSRSNLNYCKAHHVRVSGPKLGRKPKTVKRSDKIREYRDNTDRIDVEREFSYSKRCCGLGTIMTRLQEIEMGSVALSVLVSNLMKMLRRVLSTLIYLYEIKKKNTAQLISVLG